MFDGLTGSAGAGTSPTHARSVWTDLGHGIWQCNPALTGADLPDPADSARLATMTPGSVLAAECASAAADPDALDDAALIDTIAGIERLARWATGLRATLVAEFARRRPGDEPTAVSTDRLLPGSRWAPDELGLALDRTRLGAKALIAQSLQLTHQLPDTLTALQAGTIDERRADAICRATLPLPADLARQVEAAVLPAAPGRTLRQLRDRIRTAVHRADPDGEHRRHTVARHDRRVTIQARDEGMASLWINATGPDAEAAFTRLTNVARGLGTDDPRNLDQRRADLAVQALQGKLSLTDLGDVATAVAGAGAIEPSENENAGPESTPVLSEQALLDAVTQALTLRPLAQDMSQKPLIQVVVGLDTLLGTSDRPAELAGHGPLTAATARALAAGGVWKRLVTDPLTGRLLDHGRRTYRPPPALADHVAGRDQYCRFPTCTRRARDAQQDHHERFSEGGSTSADNLNAYCAHHHLLKEHDDWHVVAHTDGRITWITPTGARHTSEPYDYRPFTDAFPERTEPAGAQPAVPEADAVDLDTGRPDEDDPPPF